MTVVAAADAEVEDVDTPVVVMERLEAFGTAVLRDAMNRPSQMLNRGVVSAWVAGAGSSEVVVADGAAAGWGG